MTAIAAKFWAALAVLLLLCAAPGGAARAGGLEPLRIQTATGAHDFQVEIAADDRSHEIGLMNRRYMAPDHGMLFEFDREEPQTFWMKNTYIPLDMVFISRSGIVTNVVANAEPLSETTIPSGGACAAVLELNGGAAAKLGLKAGDRIKHPFFKG
jgi:uncharacterized protein